MERPLKKEKKGYQALNVYHEIKRRIITVDLKPGEILEEKRLAEELKVGRTPVREALLLLKNGDWIVSLPNKSAYVKEMSLKDVKDLFESLALVERQTACLAAQRMTPELLKEVRNAHLETTAAVSRKDIWEIESCNQRFHQLIAEGSDNRYLVSIHRDLRNKAERLAYLSIGRDFGNSTTLDDHLKRLCQDHQDIVLCLEKKDADMMGKLSTDHVILFQNRIINYLTHSAP
jgi:DNA-binding GntR family transcriptional regulator